MKLLGKCKEQWVKHVEVIKTMSNMYRKVQGKDKRW